MRVMRMSSIDRNPNRGAVKTPGEQDARSRIFVLYVFDDKFAPDVFGTLHDVLERQMDRTRSVSACRDPGLISRLL
jgi:hypothetical protein